MGFNTFYTHKIIYFGTSIRPQNKSSHTIQTPPHYSFTLQLVNEHRINDTRRDFGVPNFPILCTYLNWIDNSPIHILNSKVTISLKTDDLAKNINVHTHTRPRPGVCTFKYVRVCAFHPHPPTHSLQPSPSRWTSHSTCTSVFPRVLCVRAYMPM